MGGYGIFLSCFSITRVASSIKFTLRVLDTKGTWKVEIFAKEDPDRSRFDMENIKTNLKKKQDARVALPELWIKFDISSILTTLFFQPDLVFTAFSSPFGCTVREARTLHSITFTARTELLEPSWHCWEGKNWWETRREAGLGHKLHIEGARNVESFAPLGTKKMVMFQLFWCEGTKKTSNKKGPVSILIPYSFPSCKWIFVANKFKNVPFGMSNYPRLRQLGCNVHHPAMGFQV